MSKTIVALDFSSKEEVVDFLKQFDEPVYVKIGMELTYACGLEMVKTVKEMGHHIFLDLKLHDIPNTVKGGMKNLAELRCRYCQCTLCWWYCDDEGCH